MTCQELHMILGNSVGWLDSEADYSIAEHIAACSECRYWTDAQGEVRAGLQSVRNSAPEFPPTLDSKVLAAFRRNAAPAGPNRQARGLEWKFNPLPALAWCTALVAAILVVRTGVEWLLPSEDRAGWIQQQHADSPAPSKSPAKDSAPRTPTTVAQSEILPAGTAARQTQSRHEAIGRRTTPPVVDEQVSSLPSGFTGLMYCDALSCAGAMEVVRVQFPPQELGLTPAHARSSDFVSADVFVGADGVARGVRIVE